MSKATKKEAATARLADDSSRHALSDVSNSNRRRTRSQSNKERAIGATAAIRNERGTTGDKKASTKDNGVKGMIPNGAKPPKRGNAKRLGHADHFSIKAQQPSNEEAIDAEGSSAETQAVKSEATTKDSSAKKRRWDEDQGDEGEGQGEEKTKNPPIKMPRLLKTQDDKPHARAQAKRPTPRQLANDLFLESNHNLVRYPFDAAKYTAGLSDYDSCSRGQVLQVPEYVADIFQRLYHRETQYCPRPYMHTQPSLTPTMRAILVDWLVEVHGKFRLEPETLHLCISIFDRYLSVAQVGRTQVQLVGVTALLLACKYEEIYPPEVKDCVYITDRAYAVQDVLDMELTILHALEFKLTVPTTHPFLKRFLFLTNATHTMKIAANFYAERVLQEYEFLSYRPSEIAVAAVCLACNHPGIRVHDSFDGPMGLPAVLLNYTSYDADYIRQICIHMSRKISEEVVTTSRRELIALTTKYDCAQYSYFSTQFDPPSLDYIDTEE